MINKKNLIILGILVSLISSVFILMKINEKPEFGACKTDVNCELVRCEGAYCDNGKCVCPIGESKKLSDVKVASLYEAITDGNFIDRDMNEVINILKETKTDFIFRGFWRLAPVPETCEQWPQFYNQCKEHGYSYTYLKDGIQKIKKEMPEIFINGAIGAQYIHKNDWDPIKEKIIEYPQTWNMALDPSKWGIPYSKEKFQCEFAKRLWWISPETNCSDYNPEKQSRYFPDITNKKYYELLLNLAKKQIDCGVDAIWIDGLFGHARLLKIITKDDNHISVSESFEASSKLVDDIHNYGNLKGKYIYVGTWGEGIINLPSSPPNVDFVTYSPSSTEIINMDINDEKWNNIAKEVRAKMGSIPIFIFIDWAKMDTTPMGSFSQNITSKQQVEFLKYADDYFEKRGMKFIYPVHGGYMGDNAKILSFGISKNYDSLAPEFQTYETIKGLALKKAGE